MAEFGQTGKWLILPVKLCVLLLGAYYVFSGVFQLGRLLINGPPIVLTVNGTGSVFAAPPTAAFLEQLPEAIQFNVISWLYQLHELQLIIYCLGGLTTLLAIFCLQTTAAYTLYLMSILYGVVFFITHVGVLICYQQKELLDFLPSFRGQREFQVLFFGELAWPSSFWYQFAAQMLLKMYFVFSAADLYYSWYLILKAGGSGYELMAANELPGWDRYLANLEKRKKAGMVPESQPSPEELQQMLAQFQRMQQSRGSRGAFGDAPAATGIPVNLN